MSEATTRAALMTEHRDYIDGYAAGLADGRRIAPQPAVPVVTPESVSLIAKECTAPEWQDGIDGWHMGLDLMAFARAILALRPQAEIDVRNTPFGKEAEKLAADYLALMSECAGLREQLASLRPQAVPMTPDHIWANDGIMSANGIIGFKFDAVIRIVRAVEAHHGITAKAEGSKP